MDLREWIEAGGHRVMTIDQFAALPAGHPTKVVPLDFLLFELATHPKHIPHVEPGKSYAPREFFEPIAITFVRDTDLSTDEWWYPEEATSAVTLKSTDHLDGRFVYSDGSESPAAVHSARADRHAITAGGDGWTRYAPIAALYEPDLPNVVWRP